MPDADGPPVRYALSGRIARITLNRPQHRNALSAEVVQGLLAALHSASADDTVRVIVLTGAGEKAFCAGGDLADLARMGGSASQGAAPPGPGSRGAAPPGLGSQGAAPPGPGSRGAAPPGPGSQGAAPPGPGGAVSGGASPPGPGGVPGPRSAGAAGEGGPSRLFSVFRELGKPIIARLGGHALGGGLGLAVSCDIAVAADDIKLGTPEINVGLWPMMIMAVLNRNIGPKQAFKLYYTGELISAGEAVRIGLLTEAVARAALDTRVNELADQIAAKSPAALRLGRRAFFDVEGLPLGEQLSYLLDQLAVLAATDDAREGIAAFLEKRLPRYSGT